jgi:hypothetical protein
MSAEVAAAAVAPQGVAVKPLGMRKNGKSNPEYLPKALSAILDANATNQGNNGMNRRLRSAQKLAIPRMKSASRKEKLWLL